MKPFHRGRYVLLGVLLLGVVSATGIYVWPTARLEALKTRMPKLEIPPGTDRYDAKLRHVFRDAFAPDIALRCLFTGGMMETAVFLKGREVCVLQTLPGSSIWNHEYRELILDGEITSTNSTGEPLSKRTMVREYERIPVSLEGYPLHRLSAQISERLSVELKAVWRDALEHAERNDTPRIGLDGGTSTYFLRTNKGQELAGSIWSPDEGPAAALDNVAFALCAAAHDKFGAQQVQEAISAYWEEAKKRTPTSQELDHNETPLARRSSR